MISHQYSRAEAQCDYCGDKLNRHNVKGHTDSKHKGLPVKERFKRQSDDLKVILEHTTKILEGIDEIKQIKTENKIESKHS